MIKITTLLKLYILSLLETPQHGYKLMHTLKNNFKVSPSQIYPFLKQLRKEKLIAVKQRSANGRIVKVYILTNRGRKLLSSLTDKVEGMLDSMIKSKIVRCINCGCNIYGNAYITKIKNKKLKFCCEHCAKNYITK